MRSLAERIKTVDFLDKRHLLNNRICSFLNAYGLRSYGDDLAMNLVISQLYIDEFYTPEGKAEYNDIVLKFWELSDIGYDILRLKNNRQDKI